MANALFAVVNRPKSFGKGIWPFCHGPGRLHHPLLSKAAFLRTLEAVWNKKAGLMNLNITKLTKVYPNGVKAIDNLNLEIGPGMFGLLGPNGAGKSTLMRTAATLQRPDSGSITFGGIDVQKDPMSLRKILGYLPQDFGVYPKISAQNLLDYLARLKGIHSKRERSKLIEAVLETTNLSEVRRKHVDGFSGGMKQRFGIAQLLLNNPKLIIVDEPTAGLDPAERNRFLNILREIGAKNTVIFSTHIVDDVKDLCTDMAIMNGGRVLQHLKPTAATAALAGQIWARTVSREELESMEALFPVLSAQYQHDHSIQIRVHAAERPAAEFTPTQPQLEDVYFIALREGPGKAEVGKRKAEGEGGISDFRLPISTRPDSI